jgi:predicted nucleic acid-binding protein
LKVLVDTPVWSLALRRKAPVDDHRIDALRGLIADGRAALVGPIRQELLSGVRDRTTFEALRAHLGAFPDEPIAQADYERAARHFNICRSKGIQGSNTDFLLCAVAERNRFPIFTADADFARYAKLLPIRLFAPR